jgi:general L-amino acid transport system permease protein
MQISWTDPAFRALVSQFAVVCAVVALAWFLMHNTVVNLASQGRAIDFDYVNQSSALEPAEAMISWTDNVSTYGRLFLIGIINSIRVAVPGIVLATILGTIIGVGRLSKNWLIAKVTATYVDVLRQLPLLLQLFGWHAFFLSLGNNKAASHLGSWLFLSGRGVFFPELVWSFPYTAGLLAFIAGATGTWFWAKAAKRKQELTGARPKVWPVALGLCILFPVVVWAVLGAPFEPDLPKLIGFNFHGGGFVSPEYLTMLFGLTIYTSSYVAEIVRSGLQAVPQGQWEAAAAIGLHPGQVLRQIILPQATRVIIPPMTSQYLNLTKNSSLGVAIGYPELVESFHATLEPTGRAVEGMVIVMAVYLTFSLSTSVFMNWYNKHIALVER